MLINTHGIEVEENEHAVERKQYNDILPRIEHSDIAKELKQQAGTNHLFKCLDTVEWRAADRIMELEAEVKELKDIALYVLLEREELESEL